MVEEIRELRQCGVEVIACSSRCVREGALAPDLRQLKRETLCLEPPGLLVILRALWICLSRFARIGDLVARVLFEGREPPLRRARALVHTLLGAYYAAQLRDRNVQHIHVHHGYFSSWIAMVAARFLGVSFSMTLHGSDLLLHASYLDRKLAECKFCITVSKFNRRYILAHYPRVNPKKILVQRIGVAVPAIVSSSSRTTETVPVLLAVGRLHPVKNHTFLLQACSLLREGGARFRCLIVGDGPERSKLELLKREFKLEDYVTLVGHVPHSETGRYYQLADLVVMTSRSEGVPLVLMEAMANGKIVLAPNITGIPELVIDGETGFLYKPGALEEFVWRVLQICASLETLEPVRRAAREHVLVDFNQQKNLKQFVDLFLERVSRGDRSCIDENLVLQQI